MRSVERAVTAALKVMFYSHRCLPFLSNQNTKTGRGFRPVIFEMTDNKYQPMERNRLREALINS